MELKYKFQSNQSEIKIHYKDNKILVLDNVLSESECTDLINLTNHTGRYNIIFNDLSTILKERISPYINTHIFIEDKDLKNEENYWTFQEINHHWKYYKKERQSKLSQHYDGICVYNVDCKSVYSILVYLENSDGNLRFIKEKMEIVPKKGRVLIFHMSLLHEGLENKEAKKIFFRSKLMYTRDCKIENENDKKAAEIYSKAFEFDKNNKKRNVYFEEACALSPQLEKEILGL